MIQNVWYTYGKMQNEPLDFSNMETTFHILPIHFDLFENFE
jgi:hypothetical protein